MKENTYLSKNPTHPGLTLDEELEYIGISQSELSVRTGLTEKHISNIIRAKASISPDTALKLEKVLNLKASFWLTYQRNYDESIARIKAEEELDKEIILLSKFKDTYNELKKIAILPKLRWNKKNFLGIIKNLHNFFGIDSLAYIEESNISAAFRKYKRAKQNNYTIAAWLRLGQIKAQTVETNAFDEKKLKDSLSEIKKLSLLDCELQIFKKLEKLLKELGIVLVCLPNLKNTHSQGACMWLRKDKAVIILKTRKQSFDKFWFNLFHEIAHLLKHSSKKTFLDLEDDHDSPEEKEADDFAQKLLLPNFSYSSPKKLNEDDLSLIAKENNVTIDIVAGRLAHLTGAYSYYRKFIKTIDYQNIDTISVNRE